MTIVETDAERACLVALLCLPKVGPARARALLERGGGAEGAWSLVRDGRLDDVDLRAARTREALVAGMVAAARAVEPADVLAAHRAAGVTTLVPGDPGWPLSLLDDPEPPIALFAQGDLDLLAAVSVAVVGARRCTAGGAHVAGELGAGLTAAGVHVVSGLALGIDGAAHRGVLGAGGRPVGVVGSGLDRPYPPRHRRLWAEVAEAGVLVSESPLGASPERWRFPARNRIIAGLAAAVVVVESRRRGGAMGTAAEALRRDRDVLAVPGSVLAEASTGTNQLLTEGAGVVRDATDVLAALGAAVPPAADDDGPAASVPALDLPGPVRVVAGVLSPSAAGVEHIAAAADVGIADALTALAQLEAAGLARRVPGGYEQVLA